MVRHDTQNIIFRNLACINGAADSTAILDSSVNGDPLQGYGLLSLP